MPANRPREILLTIDELRAGLSPEKRAAIREALAPGIALTGPILLSAARQAQQLHITTASIEESHVPEKV
jgi:TRAP-type uncharacterized transport system fused permease subunit